MEFSINDYKYEVENIWADLSLIQVCSLKGVMIPRFCYFSKLSIAGNCRMCLIEDGETGKLIASCAIPVSDNLSVYTNTMKIRNTREAVLEFLLINHPLDCPICDQGGECDLQDQSMVFGGDKGRFYDFKRSVENKNCGPLIKTVMNRCIHCTRCVRFAAEIAGISSLGITGRGSSMQIGFYIQKLFNSEISGNVIDLCPVGALTSKPYAFTSRPWELRSVFTVDPTDSLCSSIKFDIRGTSVLRVLPRTNSFLNSDWISDRVRFFYDGLYRQRLSTPFVRMETTLISVSWRTIFFCLKKILFAISDFLFKYKKAYIRLSFGTGPSETLETCFSIKTFLQKMSSSVNYLFSEQDAHPFISSSLLSCPEIIDLICLSSVNLRYQSPVFNVLIREIYTKANVLVLQMGSVPFNNFYYKHMGNVPSKLFMFSRGKFLMSPLFQRYIFPLVLSQWKNSFFEQYTNLYQTGIWNGFFQYLPSVSNVQKKFLGLAEFPDTFSNALSIRYNVNRNVSLSKSDGPNVFFYQGHHGGDLVGNSADFVFPASTFIENNSTFLNCFGMKQQANKALSLRSFYNSRSSWKIIKMVSYFFGIFMRNVEKNQAFFVGGIGREFPTPGAFLNKIFAKLAYQKSSMAVLPFSHRFFSSYQVENISSNSKILSLCNSYMKLPMGLCLPKQSMG